MNYEKCEHFNDDTGACGVKTTIRIKRGAYCQGEEARILCTYRRVKGMCLKNGMLKFPIPTTAAQFAEYFSLYYDSLKKLWTRATDNQNPELPALHCLYLQLIEGLVKQVKIELNYTLPEPPEPIASEYVIATRRLEQYCKEAADEMINGRRLLRPISGRRVQEQFNITRKVLAAYIKSGELHDYRVPGHARTAAYRLDSDEVDRVLGSRRLPETPACP